MKKTFCTVTALLLTAALLTGCGTEKEEYAAGTYTAEETISSVSIDVHDREIEVAPSEDGRVHISYHETEKEKYDISVSDSGALTMTAADNKEWTDYIGTKAPSDARKITIRIPDGALELLDISTTNEDIALAPLNADSVSLDVNGGSISFERLNAEASVALNAKNGNIIGSIVGGYDDYTISHTIKKGECNLSDKDGGTKSLKVSCNNGDIGVDFVG